jgi:two-component system, chemotaxis family, sensor kinase CheA
MDRDKLQTFVMAAEDELASVRSSLIITAQTGDPRELSGPRAALTRLKASAKDNELTIVQNLCKECEESIEQLTAAQTVSPGAAYSVLDTVARIEAAVWDVPIQAEDFLADVSGFIDRSFDELISEKLPEPVESRTEETEEFEIDEETFEIFRSEADELLSNIAQNLGILSATPADQNALWEVRRNAHTFKGAAGIVGLKEASEVAHRMEDLLDKLVEMRSEAGTEAMTFLVAASKKLTAITSSKDHDDNDEFDDLYNKALAALNRTSVADPAPSGPLPAEIADPRPEAKSTTTPIVRVSLDRLDELIKISNSLIVNRSAIQETFLSEPGGAAVSPEFAKKLEMLFDAQTWLTDEIQAKLLQIRMVKFGTLETRLSRNVHVTCTDEGKKAVLEIENGETEIDTQVIDALIEPLLHLLKNAVVHGIEPPETRRLLGKPERGRITVDIRSSDALVTLIVTDDGSGISVAKLKEKAVAGGLITQHQADSMNDRSAIDLIFDRGLTTAGKVDLNAGRGVGMSIVKEAIEGRDGSVTVKTEPQRGTTFTITLPIARPRSISDEIPEPEAKQVPSAPSNQPPLVLIVDDSASIRRQSTKLVEQAGLRVITANNGADALELLLNGEWEPDLILSDVEMPQIDGWGFLEYVKTDSNFGHIPVVMITSLDADEHRQRAVKLGASDYVIKPLKEPDLNRLIGDHLTERA